MQHTQDISQQNYQSIKSVWVPKEEQEQSKSQQYVKKTDSPDHSKEQELFMRNSTPENHSDKSSSNQENNYEIDSQKNNREKKQQNIPGNTSTEAYKKKNRENEQNQQSNSENSNSNKQQSSSSSYKPPQQMPKQNEENVNMSKERQMKNEENKEVIRVRKNMWKNLITHFYMHIQENKQQIQKILLNNGFDKPQYFFLKFKYKKQAVQNKEQFFKIFFLDCEVLSYKTLVYLKKTGQEKSLEYDEMIKKIKKVHTKAIYDKTKKYCQIKEIGYEYANQIQCSQSQYQHYMENFLKEGIKQEEQEQVQNQTTLINNSSFNYNANNNIKMEEENEIEFSSNQESLQQQQQQPGKKKRVVGDQKKVLERSILRRLFLDFMRKNMFQFILLKSKLSELYPYFNQRHYVQYVFSNFGQEDSVDYL